MKYILQTTLIISLLLAFSGTAEAQNEVNTTTEFSMKSADSIRYYRSWLGEKCIDFGTGSKKYYNWKRDFTFVGIPLFAISPALRMRRVAFRSARNSLMKDFSTEFDSYSQYAPYPVIVALKAFGYKGRSSWDRLLFSAAAANLFAAALVNGVKYTAREQRPDGSSKNSFPSGHTSTVFVAATMLHKEYGMTRSPWFSVGGYALATTTGFMRVMNNRHWVSDVAAGAGIGIMATELGYWISDLVFGNKGITHLELDSIGGPERPTFFNTHMGIAVHKTDVPGADAAGLHLGTSASMGMEAAYFINKHVGVGGLARVTTTPASFDSEASLPEEDRTQHSIADASFDLGAYGNMPLGRHFSLGAKLLFGARLTRGCELKNENIDYKIEDSNAFNIVCGVSATYHYKQNFAWRIFADFDSTPSQKMKGWTNTSEGTAPPVSRAKGSFDLWTFGGAFTITL